MNSKIQSVSNFSGTKTNAGNLSSGCHKRPGNTVGKTNIKSLVILDEAKLMINESHKLIQEAQLKVDKSLKLL